MIWSERRLREKRDNLEFVECEACVKKPGSPELCVPCLHNRACLADARARLREAAGVLGTSNSGDQESRRVYDDPACLMCRRPTAAYHSDVCGAVMQLRSTEALERIAAALERLGGGSL
jgi:hypothetical protein